MKKTTASTTAIKKYDIKQLLEHGQHSYWCQLNAVLINQVCEHFARWPSAPAPDTNPERSSLGKHAEYFVHFLHYAIENHCEIMRMMVRRYGEYSKRYSKAVTEDERRQHILDYAAELGADKKRLAGDRKAFSRWFGHDALCERYKRRHLEGERYLSFLLQSLGRIAAIAIEQDGLLFGHKAFWKRLNIEPLLKDLLTYGGDSRVLASAFQALILPVSKMPEELQEAAISPASLRFIYHASLQSTESVWVQCEALQLLKSASAKSLSIALRKRLQYPGQSDDDLFVRRKVVQLLGMQLCKDPELVDLFALVLKDESPSVRQKIPEALLYAERAVIEKYYPALLFDDDVEQVRASALLSLETLLKRKDCFNLALGYLEKSLKSEKDKFPLRVALKVCVDGMKALQQTKAETSAKNAGHHDPEQVGLYFDTVVANIHELHTSAKSLAVRRWAAQNLEKLRCLKSSLLQRQLQDLRDFVLTIKPGKTRRLPEHLAHLRDGELARLLSVIAQDDFGFDVERGRFGCFITRGHVFGFRWWRFLHEFRHPSPDKRQAFCHTHGRLFWGYLRIPSAILSELAETKVPGEPFFIGTEEGWRGYLPLVDDAISALDQGGKSTLFYHAEGITELQPPSSWFMRRLASWRLCWHFVDYARLRNWQEDHQEPADSYLKALAKLGFRTCFHPHDKKTGEENIDPAVLRFFPAVAAIDISALWQDLNDYFISVYENNIYQLIAFITAASTYFLGRHLYMYRKLRKARGNIPLVLGGWGTRGKSGTERIKSALMNALGYSIISKTTGCEAMFIHAHPFGELREMFLFRPYDKATIWEQHNLVCLADRLHCEIFLWECMGLTPSYIDILQRQWMNDDIATITNTYPDHEDLQGPAGINIPQVMTQFIPPSSSLVTTEEQMVPILAAAAKEANTQFTAVGWLEAGLLAPDVLERFPYDEHPFNISLVLALGYQLGVGHDFALKEMADRVVADIGVLKTSACANWRSRRLQFINGMSANERFGCMGNWSRMGLDRHTIEKDVETWVTTVINNRADRIARSRVFSSIVVKDISFDRCVLIGNNLTGFVSYVRESWAEWIAGVSLVSDEQTPAEILLAMAQRFKSPYSEDIVTARLEKMLQAQTGNVAIEACLSLYQKPDELAALLEKEEVSHSGEIIAFLKLDLETLKSYQDFADKLSQATANVSGLQTEFEQLLWRWFEAKIVVVEDYYATGNQVIKQVADATPPGFYNRIIGMQNIKGTGLDFVYRWQAWDICHRASLQLQSDNETESGKGLQLLAGFQEYGFLAEEMVRETVAKVTDSAMAQNERYQAELKLILSNLDAALGKLNMQKAAHGEKTSPFSRLNDALEAFLDAFDAVRRRKRADRIYQDMVDERISHERAAVELQRLNKRQKGGWLKWIK